MDDTTRHSPGAALVAAASLVALLVALLVAPAAALAKEGAWVTLTQPIARDAAPGSTITVEFSVSVPTEDGPAPMYGSPVFVRLTAPDGTTTEGFGTEDRGEPGLYRAQVVVPTDGIESAAFGLRGTAYVNGTASRADELFEIHGWLFTTTAVPAVADSGTDGAGGIDLRAPIAIAIVIAVGGLGLVAALRKRPLATA